MKKLSLWLVALSCLAATGCSVTCNCNMGAQGINPVCTYNPLGGFPLLTQIKCTSLGGALTADPCVVSNDLCPFGSLKSTPTPDPAFE